MNGRKVNYLEPDSTINDIRNVIVDMPTTLDVTDNQKNSNIDEDTVCLQNGTIWSLNNNLKNHRKIRPKGKVKS